jgi:hypothetical protein
MQFNFSAIANSGSEVTFGSDNKVSFGSDSSMPTFSFASNADDNKGGFDNTGFTGNNNNSNNNNVPPFSFSAASEGATSFGSSPAGAEATAVPAAGHFSFGGGWESNNGGSAGFGGFAFGGGEGSSAGFSFGGEGKKKSDGGGGGDDDGDGDDDGANPEEETGFSGMTSAPLVQVQEVSVSTGEEGERQSFPATRAKLYQFEGELFMILVGVKTKNIRRKMGGARNWKAFC